MNPLNVEDSVKLFKDIVIIVDKYNGLLSKDEITFTLLKTLFVIATEGIPITEDGQSPEIKEIDEVFMNYLSKCNKNTVLSTIATWFSKYYLLFVFDGYKVSDENFNKFHNESPLNGSIIPFPTGKIRGEIENE